MSNGNPAHISLGPGTLWIAPLATTAPTDVASAWPAGWVQLGYTDKGSKFEYTVKAGEVEVAEELDFVKIAMSGRTLKVTFDLAEITATNLKRALNGGTVTTGGSVTTFTPPVLGAEVRTMLGFWSQDQLERWVFNQCIQVGAVAMSREKAPNKTTIPSTFQLELPTAGGAPFTAIFDNTRQ